MPVDPAPPRAATRDPGTQAPGTGRIRVLGIDPGLQRTGYALLADDAGAGSLLEAGLVRLNPREALERRLKELADSLAELLAAHAPTALACEALYAHYRHPRTAILMGHARGVILAEAARAGVAVVSVSATQVKKTLTGSGRASKTQVQRAVTRTLRLGRPLSPYDVADAVAVALCGLHQVRAPRAAGGRARSGSMARPGEAR